MVDQVRLRRSPSVSQQAFTGAEGEVTVDTSKDTLVVHDGSTVGGIPMMKASSPVGYTKLEHFTSSGTWTKNNKPNLKKIVVTAYGGGGGGDDNYWAGSGGQGGRGYVILDVANITTNVSVTIGAGGAIDTNGGTTYFGSYIRSNGGTRGSNNGSYLGMGGKGGNSTGSNVFDLGGVPGDGGAGYSATASTNFGIPYATKGGGPGGGTSHPNVANYNATGCLGGGGATDGTGAAGSVFIEEIYGEV